MNTISKDTFWFSHDYNAKDDPKCVLLIDQLGLEGYGIFWVLIETLRGQPELCYPMALIPALAKRYGTTAQKMEAVIRGFDLFEVREEKFFYSNSLIDRVMRYKEIQDKKSAAALKANQIRWEKEKERRLLEASERTPDGIQTESERTPNLSNNKGKEIKGNNIDSSLHSESSSSDKQAEDVTPELFPSKKELTPQELQAMWNEGRGKLPKVATLTEDRKRKAKARIAEFGKTQEEQRARILDIMEHIRQSEFLQVTWGKCNFDWLIANGGNWVKVVEGNYDNKVGGTKNINDKWKE